MDLLGKVEGKSALIGVIGLGYVGLPLVSEFCKAGFKVTGFDVDPDKIALLEQGKSYFKHINPSKIKQCLVSFTPTTDFSRLADIHLSLDA